MWGGRREGGKGGRTEPGRDRARREDDDGVVVLCVIVRRAVRGKKRTVRVDGVAIFMTVVLGSFDFFE